MRVFVTGGTGLIGGAVVDRLMGRGDRVVVLSRRPAEARARLERGAARARSGAFEVAPGDPMQRGDWQRELDGCDAVLHLAGEPLWAHRWSEAHKRAVHDSRVLSTERVVEAIERATSRPRVLVSASAVGYYGPRGDEPLDEQSEPGDDFLARLCLAWEAAALRAEPVVERVVRLRTGIVLSPDGGALERMLAPFRAFVGGPIGSGEQWWPWIHLADQIGLVLMALDDPRVRGPMVAAAPSPVKMAELARALGSVLRRPSWLPVPRFGLTLLFGEGAQVLLAGQRVVPALAQRLGYRFDFPEVRAALEDLLGSGRPSRPA